MSQGEIHQLLNKRRHDLKEADYLTVIENKTAVLIRGACRVGALIANAPSVHKDALTRYGHELGMAFQMADDLLDYLSEAATIGKDIGTDIREGKLTLPIIHALGRATSADRDYMIGIINGDSITTDAFARLVKLLHRYGGIAYTRQRALESVKRAKTALAAFDASDVRETLLMIADYVLDRKM
jgi:octaprenyl-diphosphate synthase